MQLNNKLQMPYDNYALCIMNYVLKKGHLEPRSGEKTQPWVLTHGKQKKNMEPRKGGITQPWV